MYIINKDGELIEGQELTDDEVSILKEITTPHAGIHDASGEYIRSQGIAKIAHYLIENFHLSRREGPAKTIDDV